MGVSFILMSFTELHFSFIEIEYLHIEHHVLTHTHIQNKPCFSFHNLECYKYFTQPSPNKRAPNNCKFLLETTALEGKQVGREEGIWLRGIRRERRRRRRIVTNTSEMSLMCLAVAVVSQGTSLSQREEVCQREYDSIFISFFYVNILFSINLLSMRNSENGLWLCWDYSINRIPQQHRGCVEKTLQRSRSCSNLLEFLRNNHTHYAANDQLCMSPALFMSPFSWETP